MKLRIGILGTRGIPNHYGGFEQFAEYISVGLANKGHEVYVYNSHKHPYPGKMWKNIHIVHCYDPESRLGTAGQFVYDFNCIVDARTREFDVILMLGFTSCSVLGWLFPKSTTVIFNMDGMEWKRTKYSTPVRKFLLYAERLAVKYGDYYIADSPVMQAYLWKKYKISSACIAYGAEIYAEANEEFLIDHSVNSYDYFLLMARFEPENNIEMILDGFAASSSTKKFLVIGDTNNKLGKHLLAKYENDDRIQFIGAIYNDPQRLHALKIFSFLYFHGHSVGGTNPSLLEAMASKALIAAHDNPFNEAILGKDAFYFSDATDVKDMVENVERGKGEALMIKNNLEKIYSQFSWRRIIERYEKFILQCVGDTVQKENKVLSDNKNYDLIK